MDFSLRSFSPFPFFLLFLPFGPAAYSQITWEPSKEIASTSFGNNRPRIVTNRAGEPIVIWGKSSDIYLSRLEGETFTSPLKLNPNGVTIASANWMGPDIASHGDTVYVVFKQTPEDEATSHIWCIRSEDGGKTFGSAVQVENTGTDKSRFPAVTTDDDGHPIIAFMRFNASFREARWVVTRSFDFGETFTPDVLASGWSGPESEVCDCCPGTIQCSGNNVAVIYRDNNNNLRDSWAGISTDGGITFTGGVNIDQNGWMIEACPATGPDGVIIGNTLYSTFMNGQSGQALVYYNQTSIPDLYNPPSTAVPGNGVGLQQNFSRMASSGEAVALVWRHSVNFSTGLALMFTEDIHAGFLPVFDTVAVSQVANGDVAITPNDVFVVWQNNSPATVMIRKGNYKASTGIEDVVGQNPISRLGVTPNPAFEEITIDGPVALTRILDSAGRIMIESQETKINIQSLPPGWYLVSSVYGIGKFIKY